jgi:hypothetical protein
MGKDRQPGLLVYVAGVATSAVTLWLVGVLNDHGTYVMGWYANGILPVGALIVGVASGSGFALGSRFLHVRLTRSYVIGMLSTGVLDYAVATYLTYSNLLEQQHATEAQYSFLQYVQDISEGMSFSKGSTLGAAGYLFKLLEIAGFALGGMLPAALLFKMPYCGPCQKYLVKQRTGFLSTGVKKDAITAWKRTKDERAAAAGEAASEIAQKARAIAAQMRGAGLARVTELFESELEGKATRDRAATGTAYLRKCPICDAHQVDFHLAGLNATKKRYHTANIALVAAPSAVTSTASTPTRAG